MKMHSKHKRIATVLLSAMVMTCSALSFQAPIGTAAAERAALAEDAIPFDRVESLEEGSYSPDKVIVLLKQAYSRKYNRLLKKMFSDPMFKGYEVLSDPETANPDRFHLFIAADLNGKGADAVEKAIDYLQSFDEVYYAGPNKFFEKKLYWELNDPGTKSTGVIDKYHPNNPYNSSVGAFSLIQLYDAWDITSGSPNVVLGNYETLYYDHEDLIGQMWNNPDRSVSERHGYNFTGDRGSVYDLNDHGTLTAGIMCAAGNNKKGSAGVAYGSKLMATMGSGAGSAIEFQKMITFMNKNSVKIYNVCVGWSNNPEPLVLEQIRQFNGLMFMAAGNESVNIDNENAKTYDYPARYSLLADNVITVGSVDNNDHWVNSYGPNTINISAPSSVVGTGIYKTNSGPESNYGIGGGTSSASPVVAGVAALMWSANPTLTREQVKQNLLAYADYNANLADRVQGARRVNAYEAVKSVSADKGTYFFRSKANGRYLDVNMSANKLIAHDFNAGSNQKFEFGNGALKSVSRKDYISMLNTNVLDGSTPAFSTQKSDIAVAKNMNGPGYRIIKSVRVARNGGEEVDLYALEVKNANSASSDVIWAKYNPNVANQIWYIEDATPVKLSYGVYTIKNKTSGKLLEMNESNGKLFQRSSINKDNQKWEVQPTGDGSRYILRTKSKNFVGQIQNINSTPQVRAQNYVTFSLYRNINDTTGQPDGTYRIQYYGNNWCLRVQNDSTANGSPIIFDGYRKTSSNTLNGAGWVFTKIA